MKTTVGRSRLVVRFNWAAVLFIAYFLAYGYFGAVTPSLDQFRSTPGLSTLGLVLVTAVFLFLGLVAWKSPIPYQDSIALTKRDLIVFLSFCAVLIGFSLGPLQFSLFSDELAYAGSSQIQSIQAALIVPRYFSALNDWPFRTVAQLIALALMCALVGFGLLARTLTWKYRLALCVPVLLVGRLAATAMGGNSSPHPPLNLIPPFVASSLLGFHDLSFKLSYLLSYSLFIFIVCRMLERALPRVTSFLLALAVGTVPLLWHMGAVVEQALWASICFTLVLVELITASQPNYIRVISMISIATLMRQPSFLALLPVAVLFIADRLRPGAARIDLATAFSLIVPSFVFLPFLATSLVMGTPSTETIGHTSIMFERVWGAVSSNIVWIALHAAIPYWWIIFLPLAFIPLSRAGVQRNLAVLVLAGATLFVYHTIPPVAQGSPKYQAEYAAPLAIAGLLFVARKLDTLGHARMLVPLVALVLIGLNIVNFVQIPHGNKPVDILAEEVLGATIKSTEQAYRLPYQQDGGYGVLYAFPYDFKNAYEFIKSKGLSEHSYSLGVTYGVLPEIMNGYSTRAVSLSREISRRQFELKNAARVPWAGGNAELVDKDVRIKAVLLGFVLGKQELIGQFQARGWRISGEHRNSRYGSSVVVMLRSDSI